MKLPAFIDALPQLDLPFPADTVSTRALRSDAGVAVFFTFHKDFELAPHSYKAQWGIVVSGEAMFTIGGESLTYRPGDTYNIPSGVEHSGKFRAGTTVIDLFEEPDRYPLKP